jgi:hypothetical protein
LNIPLYDRTEQIVVPMPTTPLKPSKPHHPFEEQRRRLYDGAVPFSVATAVIWVWRVAPPTLHQEDARPRENRHLDDNFTGITYA